MPWSPDPSSFSVQPQGPCRLPAASSRGLAWEGPALGSRQAREHKIGSLGQVGSTERVRSLMVWGRCWVSASVGTLWASWEWMPAGAGPIGSLGVPLSEACAR